MQLIIKIYKRFSNHKTFKNWWHKWEGWVDDDQAVELAHEYLTRRKENYD